MDNSMFPELEVKQEDLTSAYRAAFKSVAGRRVLADILVNHCQFLTYLEPGSDKAIGEHNVGVAILSMLGIFKAGKENIIRALLDVPITE